MSGWKVGNTTLFFLTFSLVIWVSGLPTAGYGALEIAAAVSLERYEPLKEGAEWRYSIVRKKGKIEEKYERDYVVLAPTKINNDNVMPVKSFDKKIKGYRLDFYRIDKDSCTIVASQKDSDAKPIARNIIILKAPLKVGTTWESEKVVSTIVSVNDTITVPAGTFNNCLKIQDISPAKKLAQMRWYAPDVGDIKFDIKVGEVTMLVELISFKK
jgi:hypothetical protein